MTKARESLSFRKRIHELHRRLDERAFYPRHDKRTESAAYRRVHHELIVEKDLPCVVCGVTNSILTHPRKRRDEALNPYGARQMETHHHVVEWALANAVDVRKFNARVVRTLRARPQSDPIYQRDFSAREVAAWIDHHPDNIAVLCMPHHRHRWIGVHAISGPIWGSQALLKARFSRSVRKLLSKDA